jgi:GTP cyclohydrolase IB
MHDNDIQGSRDNRNITIDQVGISGLRCPVTFTDGHLRQAGIAEIEITVELQADRRGTHMSRMVEIAHQHLAELDPRNLPIALKTAAHHLDASAVTIAATLPISTEVEAPVTRRIAYQVHDLAVTGTLTEDTVLITTSVTTDITSLCPCSKAISDYGAHNQRSKVTLQIGGHGDAPYPLAVSDMITLIRGAGSAPVYPLVKRPDERHITMEAFDNPVFVEDIARNLSAACRSRGLPHVVQVRNIESIHSHDAVAVIHQS